MRDEMAAEAAALGRGEAIRAILAEVCDVTTMGFAALARVTEDRWIACQVRDQIEFGLNPGDELEIKTTICDDIRQSGEAVVIDSVSGHPEWATHPVPMLYGFESYASFPVFLDDGSFFGTLCAIDPEPRRLGADTTISTLRDCARRLGTILSAALAERAQSVAANP